MENLRTSSYMIPVKLEKEEGKYMLIHGYTGAADIISESFLGKIKSIEEGHNFSESMLQTLLKRGYITTKTQDEEYEYVARIAKALHKESDILLTSFTWVVSYNCNFRCPYCFEERNLKDGKTVLVFTKEQVDIAYETQDRIQPHRKLRKNIITLYGGEPLLAENKEIVNYIVDEGRRRGYKFVAVTNGYEIDQFVNLLGEDGIYRLQITLDGPREIHNQRRIHYKNHNTFDKIISNIQLALDKGTRVVVRMNSDGRNIDQYVALKEYLERKHFFDNPNFYFYIARLRGYYNISDTERESLTFMSPQQFDLKRYQLKAIPFSQDTGYYKLIYQALVNKKSIPFRPLACKAQTGEYVLDPLGNIYPCWETVGKKEHIKGIYTKNRITWNKQVLEKWQDIDVSQKEPCKYCKYALFCGGGCPYHRMLLGNEEQQCIIFRNMFKSAINKAYAEFNKQTN